MQPERPSDADSPSDRLDPNRVVVRIAVVVAGYLAYAALAALLPVGGGEDPSPDPAESAAELGRAAWRTHACTSCHSVYGLGGHTGPDLTNALSRMGEEYVRTVLRDGVRAMPAFALTEAETDAIVAYLELADRSGVYPPPSAFSPVFGVGR